MKHIQGIPTCLPTGREDRCCYSQKAIDDYIPPRRQAGLPDGRLEASFRTIANFKLVDKMEKFGYQKIKERL